MMKTILPQFIVECPAWKTYLDNRKFSHCPICGKSISYEKGNEIDDTFNKLLSLDNHPLEVSKDIDGNICIGYKDGWIDDVYLLKYIVGRGKTLTEAANNYCKLISGKTIVFLNESNREEVKVLFW